MKSKLVYVSDEEPGIIRKKQSKGFRYLDSKKKKVEDPDTLNRIKSLAIPPNWKHVWICEKDNGHLQAVGRDDKDRKQYIYHPIWTEYRQGSKFGRMAEFGRELPKIRARTSKDLKRKEWDREKVIALVIEVMDHYNLRIGNTYYRDSNGTFGVSNLRKKHLTEVGNHLELNFKGKSGQYRHIEVDDKEIMMLIKECSELPGYELFKYIGEDNKKHSIDSHDVNEYIEEVTGKDFSSKDFRTWNASALAVEHFMKAQEAVKENPKLKFKSTLVKKVAEDMGNTPSVCENYYIHPYLLEKICAEGKLPDIKKLPKEYKMLDLEPEEKVVLAVIEKAPKLKEIKLENI